MTYVILAILCLLECISMHVWSDSDDSKSLLLQHSDTLALPPWEVFIQNLSAVISLGELTEWPAPPSVNLRAPPHWIHKYFIKSDASFELWLTHSCADLPFLASAELFTSWLLFYCSHLAFGGNSETDVQTAPAFPDSRHQELSVSYLHLRDNRRV